MALKIIERKGVFLIEGELNASTVEQFKLDMEFLLEHKNELTINIENVCLIDAGGVLALIELNKHALHSKKKFSIVGNGCKEIYDDIYAKT